MSRIRSTKPEFWSSEQIMDLTIPARLCFIGMWNFCDDAGIHPASVKTLKAEVFPGDNNTDVAPLVQEMIALGLVMEYETIGKSYWHVTGWHHQKIDRPNWKHPLPTGSIPMNKTAEDTTYDRYPAIRQVFDNYSANDRRMIGEASPPEGSR